MNRVFKSTLVFFMAASLLGTSFSAAIAQKSDQSQSFSLQAAILIPTPITPNNGSSDITPTFTWTKIAKATTYQFLVYKSGALVYQKTVSSGVCNTTQCSSTPTIPLRLGKYTWKVHAHVGTAWRAYSRPKAFSIIPALPVPTSPTGYITDRTPTYTWSKVSGATKYQFILYQDSSSSAKYSIVVLSKICGKVFCSKTPVITLPYANYRWKVRAYVAGIWRPFSPVITYSLVTSASLIPNPIAPTGTVATETPTFSWSKVIPATNYRLIVLKGTTQVNAIDVSTSACSASTCSYTFSQAFANNSYSWKVSAMVNGSWQTYSITRPFTVNFLVIPNAISPLGLEFPLRPTFTWSKINNATAYEYVVYQGSTVVYENTVSASACQTNYCTDKPTSDLTASTAYTWKVHSYVFGNWRTFSSISAFSTETSGWTPVWGTWQIDANGYYTTAGVVNNEASVKYAGTYSILTYEARMKRDGACNYCANFLIIRGTPDPLNASTKEWGNYLRFQYSNNGYFSVYNSAGVISAWNTSPSIFTGDWNTLKVTANGSNMVFYINGTQVWAGSIPSAPASGKVGLGMWTSSDSNSTDLLSIDWVRISSTVVAGASYPTEFPVYEPSADANASTAPQ